ncbi:MAG: hypothetical protein IJY39_12000 [Clostridia bacterium]|nr:hypothetical protein [Clostridia bacterium]
MKKVLCLTIAIVLLLTTFILISCKDQSDENVFDSLTDTEKAEYLSQKSDEYFSSGSVEEASIILSMTGRMAGIEIANKSTATQTITKIYPETDQFQYLSIDNTTSSTKANGVEESEVYTKIDGFTGEYMLSGYLSDKDDPVYLKSRCNVEEYKAYLDEQAAGTPDMETIERNSIVTVTEDESGMYYVVVYTDLNETAKNEIESWIQTITSPIDATFVLDSFEMTYTVSKETLSLEIATMTMNFVTEGSLETELTMSVAVESKFTFPNLDVDLKPENYDEYSSTSDLRYRYYAKDRLKKLIESNDMSLMLQTKVQVKGTQGNITQELYNYKETDTMNYGTLGSGLFAYHITADISATQSDDYDLEISYDGRSQSLAQNGKMVQTVAQSQSEAKSFISSTMAPFSFTEQSVTKITVFKSDDSTVKATLFFNADESVRASFQGLGLTSGNITNASVKITVIFDENLEIISAEYAISGVRTTQGIAYTMTQTATIKDIGKADISMFSEE